MMQERELQPLSGWFMVFVEFVLLLLAIVETYWLVRLLESEEFVLVLVVPVIVSTTLLWLVWLLFMNGFFVVEPNDSRVLLLFGKYAGTVKQSGFHWVNPLMTKRTVSLRVRTLNGERLKVNDMEGNPVEIAAVVVWRVRDTFKASFEVDHYEQYVATQSETAVRQLASSFPYDASEERISLRHNVTEISEQLQRALQERLNRAGVEVLESRLSHLAYAPEIAGAMLRRQQASAVVAARQLIVEGAVGMVEMALQRLESLGMISLDKEHKAAMISNLMVVLCSEQAAQPVLNTGTLYP